MDENSDPNIAPQTANKSQADDKILTNFDVKTEKLTPESNMKFDSFSSTVYENIIQIHEIDKDIDNFEGKIREEIEGSSEENLHNTEDLIIRDDSRNEENYQKQLQQEILTLRKKVTNLESQLKRVTENGDISEEQFKKAVDIYLPENLANFIKFHYLLQETVSV